MDVIMLAHLGATQPGVWEKWVTQGRKDGTTIRLHVVSPKDPLHNKEFCEKYRLKNANDGGNMYMGQTRWGSFSLVWETILAMLHVFHRHKNDMRRLFVVSGFDVPVRSMTSWLQKNTYTGNIVGKSEWNGIEYHSQWWSLTGHMVSKMVSDYFNPKLVQKTLIDLFMDTSIRFTEHLAPDELWLFQLYEPSLFQDGFITLPYFRHKGDESPIQWMQANKPVMIHQQKGDVSLTLMQVIITSRRSSDTILFFRKVGPNVKFSPSFLDNLYSSNQISSSFLMSPPKQHQQITSAQERRKSGERGKQRARIARQSLAQVEKRRSQMSERQLFQFLRQNNFLQDKIILHNTT